MHGSYLLPDDSLLLVSGRPSPEREGTFLAARGTTTTDQGRSSSPDGGPRATWSPVSKRERSKVVWSGGGLESAKIPAGGMQAAE
jgi:hypothetical protein